MQDLLVKDKGEGFCLLIHLLIWDEALCLPPYNPWWFQQASKPLLGQGSKPGCTETQIQTTFKYKKPLLSHHKLNQHIWKQHICVCQCNMNIQSWFGLCQKTTTQVIHLPNEEQAKLNKAEYRRAPMLLSAQQTPYIIGGSAVQAEKLTEINKNHSRMYANYVCRVWHILQIKCCSMLFREKNYSNGMRMCLRLSALKNETIWYVWINC